MLGCLWVFWKMSRLDGSSEGSLASVGLGVESRQWELRRFSNWNLKMDSVVTFAAPG
jgi:hypothetical protein